MRDHIEFFRQFRERFETTGAVAPSSRFLARAMAGPLTRRGQGPVRVLEIGPGTGAVTGHIVRQLQAADTFDLVEINERFAELLEQRFLNDRRYQTSADRPRVHVCPLQEFQAEAPYDFIISGLPLNNFPSALVSEIFNIYFQLLAPGGVLSYFEYMYVRPLRRTFAGAEERQRLRELEQIMRRYLGEFRTARNWVFVNVPPAWVQHLRKPLP